VFLHESKIDFIARANLFDNSSVKNHFKEAAWMSRGKCLNAVDPLPPWAAKLLSEVL
jgi:hypothetical protein